jgi:uncharacterized BrkB/YihY/UPF0761 family membrane protein
VRAGGPPDDPSSDPDAPPDAESLARRLGTRATATRSAGERWLDERRGSVLVDVPLRMYERDGEIAGSVVGAALAMRLFTFFVPLLLLIVGLAGFARGRLSEEGLSDAGVAGRLADQVQSALEQPSQTRWLALLSGLFGVLSTGRTLSKSMVQASCLAWRIPVHAKASARLFGAVVGMLAGVGLMSLLVNVVLDRSGVGVAGVSYVGAVTIYLVVWTAVMSQAPRAAESVGSLLPGAALLAVVLASMQAVSQLYLPSRFERASALYGTIGSAVVVLGWFFIMGRVMILSMELNAVIYERNGTVTEAVFDLPVLRQLARWGWVRRVVGLDDPDEPAAGDHDP